MCVLGVNVRRAKGFMDIRYGWGMSALALLLTVSSYSAEPGRATAAGNEVGRSIEVVQVQGGVYMLASSAANVAILTGEDGVLLVDTMTDSMAEPLVAAIRNISRKTLRYIVNTSAGVEHVGGNAKVTAAGSTPRRAMDPNVPLMEGASITGRFEDDGATVVAFETVQRRMSDERRQRGEASSIGLPFETYFVERTDLFYNGEAIQVQHFPNAHSDGDSVIFFRRSDVIVTGDVYTPGSYPRIDVGRGGTIQGTLDALNGIIDLAVAGQAQEGGTLIVPGHGRLSDESDVVTYRDMVTAIRDRIKVLSDRGMTLEQVKAAKPTFDYDALYGSSSGQWTADRFIDAVYAGVSKK